MTTSVNAIERIGDASNLPRAVDVGLAVERTRVAVQIRNTHLAKRGHLTNMDIEIFEHLSALEKFLDDTIAGIIQLHPAYPWFSRVKGIGRENIAKIIGLIRIKPPGEVEQALMEEADLAKEDYKPAPRSTNPYANSVSALWKFAGYAVDADGLAPKRKKGQKSPYNSQLRMLCWRVGTSLMKAQGKYYDFYRIAKAEEALRLTQRGIRVLPHAELMKEAKQAFEKRFHHPPKHTYGHWELEFVKLLEHSPNQIQIISEGRLHNRALRKMIKLFLSHLWTVWREAEGLPTKLPYVISILGHTDYIDHWTMCDRPASKES